jgi:RHS repeat-associated protein
MTRRRLPVPLALILLAILASLPTLAQNENEQVGFSSNHMFDGGYFGENVDILNGNLSLTLPIGPRYQVTGDFAYQLSLNYNSKIWSDGNVPNRRFVGESPVGAGFSLGLGKLILATHYPDNGGTPNPMEFDLYVVTPDGARHLVVDSNGGNYSGMTALDSWHYTNDASYMKVLAGPHLGFPQVVESWRVFMPDGTTYTYGHLIANAHLGGPGGMIVPGAPDEDYPFDGWYVTRIESRERCSPGGVDGPCNHVDITYDSTFPYSLSTIQEFRNGSTIPSRQIDVTTNQCPSSTSGCVSTISVPSFSGGQATYSFSYVSDTLESPLFVTFPETTNPRFPNQALLTQVILPQGYAISFGYDLVSGHNGGEIIRRDLPTGAYSSYFYGTYQYASLVYQGGRAVNLPPAPLAGKHQTRSISRKELVLPTSPQGLTPYKWVYSREVERWLNETVRAFASPYQVTVTDPFLNDTVYSYHASLPYDPNFPDCNPCAPAWDDGLVAQVVTYQGRAPNLLLGQTGGVLIAKEEKFYEADINPYYPLIPTKNNVRSWKAVNTTLNSSFIQKTEERSGWDGWGHHRVVVEHGDGVPSRTTVTDWQPIETSTFRVADVFRFREVQSAGAVVSREDAWFDGALDPMPGRLRDSVVRKVVPLSIGEPRVATAPTAAMNGDVWTHFDYDPLSGNLQAKTIHGGDVGSHDYRIGYTWQAGGYLATKQFQVPSSGVAAFPWLAIDRDRDANTGLVVRSRTPFLSGQAPLTTSYSYDTLGRVTAITPPVPEYRTTITYNSILHTTIRQEASAGDAIQAEYFYDDLGRLITTQKLDFDSTPAAPKYVVQHTQRHVDGLVQCQSEWIKVPGPFQTSPGPYAGDLCASTGTLPPRTMLDYTDPTQVVSLNADGTGPFLPVRDPLGRIRMAISSDEKVTRTQYSGNDSTVTVEGIQGRDSNWSATATNVTTKYRRDSFGRLVSVEAPPDGPLDHYASAGYSYDAVDNLIEVRLTGMVEGEAKTQIRTFVYSALDNLIRATNPENGTVLTELFDPLGNPLGMRDGKGNVFGYTYDAAGRLLQTTFGAPALGVATNTYDVNPDVGSSGYSASKLVRSQSYDDAGQLIVTRSLSYNALSGRLGSETTRFAGVANDFSTTYTYNSFGLLGSILYPTDGSPRPSRMSALSYTNGYLRSVMDQADGGSAPIVKDVQYNPAGGIARLLSNGDVQDLVTADSRNRTGRIQVQKVNPLTGIPVANYWDTGDYAYDGAGNISEIGGALGKDHLMFSYDAVNRLVHAKIERGTSSPEEDQGLYYQADYDLKFSYDPYGNLTGRVDEARSPVSVRTFDVDTETNRIESSGAASFLYDANGNVTQDDQNVYQIDARNRLLRVRTLPAGGSVDLDEFSYDSSGNRVIKRSQNSGLTTYYVRDSQGQVLSEFSRPSTSTNLPLWRGDYIYAASRTVAMTERDKPDPPSGLLADAISNCAASPITVQLAWQRSLESDVTAYQVYRNGNSISEVPANTPSYGDNSGTLVVGATYNYQLKAKDPLATSDLSPILTVRVCDTTPPSAPASLTTVVGDSRVSLAWAISTDNIGSAGIAGYVVHRLEAASDDPSGAGFSAITSSLVTGNSYIDLSAVNGHTYWYLVKARDTSGNFSAGSVHRSATPVDSVAPAPPRNLRGHSGCVSGGISLVWDLNPESDAVQSYNLYRGILPTALSLVSTGIPAQPSFPLVTTPPDDQTYYYAVTAQDAAAPPNSSDRSLPFHSRTRGANPAPTALTKTVGQDRVTLTWQEASGQTEFTIYRRPFGGNCEAYEPVFHGVLAPESGQPTTFSYIDSSVTNGKPYEYVVSSTDSSGHESPDSSIPVLAVPLETPRDFRSCIIPGDDDPRTQFNYTWRHVASRAGYDEQEAIQYGKGYIGFVGYTIVKNPDPLELNYPDPLILKDEDADRNNKHGEYPVHLPQPFLVRAVYKINDWRYCDTYGSPDTCRLLGSRHIDDVSHVNPAYHPSYIFSGPSEIKEIPSLVSDGFYPLCSDSWPERPENVQASATENDGEIVVTWDPPANMARVAGYLLIMEPENLHQEMPIVLPPNVTSYTFTGVPPCKNLSFRIESFDTTDTDSTDLESQLRFTAAPLPLGTPPPPDNLALGPGPEVGEITVSWEDAEAVSCQMDYVEIRRSLGGVVDRLQRAPSQSTIVNSYTDSSGLIASSTYEYEVRAVYHQRDTSAVVPVEVFSDWAPTEPATAQPLLDGTGVLRTPTGVTATQGATDGTAVIYWNIMSGAEGYRLRYRGDRKRWSLYNDFLSVNTAMVSGLVVGRRYAFSVTSVKHDGTDPITGLAKYKESSWSRPVWLRLTKVDHLLPPISLAATPGPAEGQITLTWPAAPAPAAGYYVYLVGDGGAPARRMSFSGGTYPQLILAGPTSFTVTLSDLPMKARHTLAVRSVGATGRESEFSDPVSAYPLDNVPGDPRFNCAYCSGTPQVIHLSIGTSDPQTVSRYIGRSVNPGCTSNPSFQAKVFPSIPLGQNSLTDSEIAPGCTYSYEMWAIDREGNTSRNSARAVVKNIDSCVQVCDPSMGDGQGNVFANHCTVNCNGNPVSHPRITQDFQSPEQQSESLCALGSLPKEQPAGSIANTAVSVEPALAPYRIIGFPVKPTDGGGGGGGGGGGYVPPSFHWRHFHADHLGTPRIITDGAGTIISEHHYLPFGEEVPPSNHNNVFNASNNSHRFTGHERDAETGLDYMHARYFGTSLGRFMVVDPGNDVVLEDPQSWNKYTYVRNNPINATDPDGAFTKAMHACITATALKAAGINNSAIAMAVKANLHQDHWSGGRLHYVAHATGFFGSHDQIRGKAQKYADKELRKAVKAANKGNMDSAMKHLGKGLHTIQDLVAHKDFPNLVENLGKLTEHANNDDMPPQAELDAAYDATKDYLNQFLNNTGGSGAVNNGMSVSEESISGSANEFSPTRGFFSSDLDTMMENAERRKRELQAAGQW